MTKGVTGKMLKIKLLIVNRLETHVMKHLLLTTIAVVVLVGCATTQSPKPPTVKAPAISIYDAAKAGNIEAVKQHIAAGTDVNAVPKTG